MRFRIPVVPDVLACIYQMCDGHWCSHNFGIHLMLRRNIFQIHFSNDSYHILPYCYLSWVSSFLFFFVMASTPQTPVQYKISVLNSSLQWRHNGDYGVSNHQPSDCLLSRLIRRRSKKTSKLRITGLCAGNSPGTGEWPVTRKMFPFDDVSC